jgi:hypothetical protein
LSSEPNVLLAETSAIASKDVMARQMLTVQATTRGSAHGLYSALSAFHPELEIDGHGESCVSVELGSDRQAREIFDALDLYRDSHSVDPVVSSVATARGDRHYSFNLI